MTDDLALGDTVATGTINASDLNFDPTGAPTITGPPPTVGVALAVDTSAIDDADGLSGATYEYQWMVDDGTTPKPTSPRRRRPATRRAKATWARPSGCG